MAEIQVFPYRFNWSEPALFVEIYLPKKIRYQGILHDSLRRGFDVQKVKKHLKSPKEFVTISEFLEDYRDLSDRYKRKNRKEIHERVNKMEEVFYGYSMYEVDGVFFNKARFNKREDKKEKINKFIAEESVQVIRMIFMIDSKKILSDLDIRRDKDETEFYAMRRFLVRNLESQHECKEEITQEEQYIKEIDNNKENTEIILNNKKIIFEKIKNWIDDIALFLFGFVIYNICQEIKKLQQEDERPEDEIWVTSFWNLEVNRITRRE